MYYESAYEIKRMQKKITVVNNIDQIKKFKKPRKFCKIYTYYFHKEGHLY